LNEQPHGALAPVDDDEARTQTAHEPRRSPAASPPELAAPDQAEALPTDGRTVTIGWQAIVLPALAVAAVVGGFAFGRQASVRPAAAPAPVVGNPAAYPAGDAQVRVFEMGELGDLVEIAPSGRDVAMAPGVAADQVVPLPPSSHVLVGKPAPDLVMTLLATDEQVDLASYLGQPVLVNFWATWCPPCRVEMPWLQAVHERYEGQGFTVLAVDAGERVPPTMVRDHIRRFVDTMGLTVPVLYGDNTFEVQKDWNVIGLPASFLIAPDGTVADAHAGAYPNEVTLDAHVQQILGAR